MDVMTFLLFSSEKLYKIKKRFKQTSLVVFVLLYMFSCQAFVCEYVLQDKLICLKDESHAL